MNDLPNRLRENGPSSGFVLLMNEAADFIESQIKVVLAYIDQHARDSAELRRLCYERDKAKERVQALEAKCALLAASLAQSEGEVEERDGRIATLTTVAPAVDAQPVAWMLEWTHSGEVREQRLYDDECHCLLDAETNGGVCIPLGRIVSSAQSEGLRKDAERYRFARDNITEGYGLPGGFYLSDCEGGCWDKTIDAALSQHTGEQS